MLARTSHDKNQIDLEKRHNLHRFVPVRRIINISEKHSLARYLVCTSRAGISAEMSSLTSQYRRVACALVRSRALDKS